MKSRVSASMVCVVTTIVVAGVAIVHAAGAVQAPAPTGDAFELATFYRNIEAEQARAAAVAAAPGVARPPGRATTQRGGTLNGRAMTVRELIRDAYGFRNRALSDVTGGPGWLDWERYDVTAKAAIELGTSGMAGLPPVAERLLRKLLEDRLQLKLHTEMRQRQVYELVMAQNGQLGKGLKPSTQDCSGFYGFSTSTGLPLADAPPPKPICSFRLAGGVFSTGNMTMEELVRFLPAFPSINTVVIDKTGLKGGYDITVEYQLADLNAANSPEMAARPLFNQAFEQQTGIKLVKTQGQVEILVIDRVERPSAN